MKDRNKIKELILNQKRNLDEENFDEAIAVSFRACKRTEIPIDIQDLFQDPKTQNLVSESSKFWILVRCVKDFVEDKESGNGMLPLIGTLPDMKADSNRYIALQNWSSGSFSTNGSYRRKFKDDFENVAGRVKKVLLELGRSENEISRDEIQTFCKHAGYLKVICFRSLQEEYSSPKTTFIRLFPVFKK
jgi:NEDD8-activating enzyme E1 regulatory subunit